MKTDTGDFYIDLVFYNFRMKRFVLFELKTQNICLSCLQKRSFVVR
nr:hypothetical protein [uncultured Prevotella sp.]